jgi:hypothetical protein
VNALNSPAWSPQNPKTRGAFHEVWYLKLNDPVTQRALWLRMTLLISANGFRRIAETWAVYFQRNGTKEVTKLALKETFDVKSFTTSPNGDIKIGECEFSGTRSRGKIQSKGKTISWDLQLATGHDAAFNLVPESLKRAGLVKNSAITVGEDLRFSGTTEITDPASGNGEPQKITWNGAAGMQGHLSGTKSGHSWVWGHCNLFVDDHGKPVPFIFEGLSAKAQLMGTITSPKLSTFYFHYEGQPYAFNSLWDAVRVKSKNTLTDWEFQADRGELSFRGKAKAELKDFAGLTYEDTNGSLLYCANSKLSDMQVHVYRRGKLESAFYSNGMAAFEVVSRDKNPYVPLLV